MASTFWHISAAGGRAIYFKRRATS